MEGAPRLLVWNYSKEEKERLDALLKEIGAPPAVTIEKGRGNLTLREIIHTDTHSESEFSSDEKVILFYNIPQKGVFFLIDTFNKSSFPRPIYAVVTEHSIEWPFSELLDHLVGEKKRAEEKSTPKPAE